MGYFQDYSDVGGGREALIAAGETLATSDEVVARKLIAERLVELEQRRRNRTMLGIEQPQALEAFAAYHLVRKKKAGRVSDRHIADQERYLREAVRFFGASRDLASIGVGDVERYLDHVRGLPARTGGTIGARAQYAYIQPLVNLYRRAIKEKAVPPGFNPATDISDAPSPSQDEWDETGAWLEVWEAALVLQAAKHYEPGRGPFAAIPFMYPLVATYLLTGARDAEVKGLELADLSFERGVVSIRRNQWRGLKTKRSRREVPMWPQLREILLAYLNGPHAPKGKLLFPSPRHTQERMIDDLRKPLSRIALAAGFSAGDLHPLVFRHTYATTRRLTVDRVFTVDGSVGFAPVNEKVIEQEMGHATGRLLQLIYTHLPRVPWRSEVVEYRLEQHGASIPAPRLHLVAA
jgi:integrase